MKILKGYTLSQFIDYLETELAENRIKHHEEYDEIYFSNYVSGYNDFLKQPLTKDMFVNEIKKPDKYINDIALMNESEYKKDLKAWEESEKKVIFKGFEKVSGSDIISLGEIEITSKMRMSINYSSPFQFYKTIGDLFHVTNGELELQNISI